MYCAVLIFSMNKMHRKCLVICLLYLIVHFSEAFCVNSGQKWLKSIRKFTTLAPSASPKASTGSAGGIGAVVPHKNRVTSRDRTVLTNLEAMKFRRTNTFSDLVPIAEDPLIPSVERIVMSADARKAASITALRVTHLTEVTQFMIIIEGFNARQNQAIASFIEVHSFPKPIFISCYSYSLLSLLIYRVICSLSLTKLCLVEMEIVEVDGWCWTMVRRFLREPRFRFYALLFYLFCSTLLHCQGQSWFI
jgi:hypothetical protein